MRTFWTPLARPSGLVAAAALLALLTAVTAVNPALGLACAPVLVVGAVAARYRAVTARVAAIAAAAAVLVVLVLLAAVEPRTAVTAAAAGAVAAVALHVVWNVRRQIARPAGVAALLIALIGLALAVALWPSIVAPATAAVAAMAVAGFATLPRRKTLGQTLTRALAAAAKVVGGFMVVVGLAALLALWPATALLGVIVLGILVLAWRAPVLGLAAAVLLFEFEGSVKLLLGLDGAPLPGDNRALGAAALDLALAGAVAGLLIRDRFRAPRGIWASATRVERIAIGIVAAWLALSVIQMAPGGNVIRGLQGFRLFQWYTLLTLATLTVFAQPRLRAAATRGVLVVGLLVSLYAAVRVVIGPSDDERAFATAVQTVTMYGQALRAIGSFSSAIGLSSFLTPLAVFALSYGLLMRRDRLLSWTVGGLAIVGLIGSYSRTSLFGVALGLVCALGLVFAASDMSRRRKLAGVGLLVVLLAGTYGGVLVASRASPELRARAEGMLHPLRDESVRLRLRGWERTLRLVAAQPLGHGVGTAGAASAPTRVQINTTDNSYLKVLYEQGVGGLALFVCGIFGAVALLARRLRRAAAEPRAVGLAALAGFVAFLGIAFAGETVEQPGKVLAWGLLGMAVAMAFASARGAGRAAEGEAA
jgi:O-antigen ligase